MHEYTKRFLVCNVVLITYLTSIDLIDFLLRVLMMNILYSRLVPEAPSLVSGWEKHFCDWLSSTFVRVSTHVFNMPAFELVIVLVVLKLLSWVTYFLPSWLLIILVAEIIALKPFIAPFEEIVGPELHNLKKKFEASVMRIYRMIPRYSKPIVP